MEDFLERDLERPFIHWLNGLARELEVFGRPYLIFVDSGGNIHSDREGLWTDVGEMTLSLQVGRRHGLPDIVCLA